MALFERSILLNVTPSEVYAFHEDPRNICKISPQSLRVERVECRVPAREGEEFRLRVSQFGVPMEWVGYWEKIVPDELLVDGARKSPFQKWHHHHFFRQEGENCLMTDRVIYALPGGLMGRLLDETVMKAILTIMFIARHKATQAYFSSHSNH
jgi:ligand-binding SRPBCC domain-containing protein